MIKNRRCLTNLFQKDLKGSERVKREKDERDSDIVWYTFGLLKY